MTRCLLCDSPLPEGRSHPPYFAQARNDPGAQTLQGFADDLHLLFSFTRAVFDALYCVQRSESGLQDTDETVEYLTHLGLELVAEAEWRAGHLYAAGCRWQNRAHKPSGAKP